MIMFKHRRDVQSPWGTPLVAQEHGLWHKLTLRCNTYSKSLLWIVLFTWTAATRPVTYARSTLHQRNHLAAGAKSKTPLTKKIHKERHNSFEMSWLFSCIQAYASKHWYWRRYRFSLSWQKHVQQLPWFPSGQSQYWSFSGRGQRCSVFPWIHTNLRVPPAGCHPPKK